MAQLVAADVNQEEGRIVLLCYANSVNPAASPSQLAGANTAQKENTRCLMLLLLHLLGAMQRCNRRARPAKPLLLVLMLPLLLPLLLLLKKSAPAAAARKLKQTMTGSCALLARKNITSRAQTARSAVGLHGLQLQSLLRIPTAAVS